jgi:hypothetical protein
MFIMYGKGTLLAFDRNVGHIPLKNPVKSCSRTNWQWKKRLPISSLLLLFEPVGSLFCDCCWIKSLSPSTCTILGQYSRSERITRQEVLKLIFPKQLIKDQSYVV